VVKVQGKPQNILSKNFRVRSLKDKNRCSQNREIPKHENPKAFGGKGEPRVVKPFFRCFGDRELEGTRSLGELTCRSPETLKHKRWVG
jgi:hypothetical protein